MPANDLVTLGSSIERQDENILAESENAIKILDSNSNLSQNIVGFEELLLKSLKRDKVSSKLPRKRTCLGAEVIINKNIEFREKTNVKTAVYRKISKGLNMTKSPIKVTQKKATKSPGKVIQVWAE